MRSRVAWPLVTALLAACTEGTAPVHQTTQVSLDFCADQIPSFFAYLNEGSGSWVGVNPNVDGTVTFNATDKVGIAMVFQDQTTALTDVYFASLDELQPLLGQACTETSGTKTLNGSIANVGNSQEAVISMSGAAVVVTPPNTGFQLTNVASGNQDLVAQREALVGNNPIPDKIIIRRNQNFVNGALMSTLDFNGTEAQAVATNSATITGMSAGEQSFLDVSFTTASGTGHSLYPSAPFTTSPQTIFGVPATLTQAGDLHHLQLETDNPSASTYRGVIRFYRNPSDMTLALGAVIANPSFSTIANAPYTRLRATLPVQPDYASFATASYFQITSTTRSFYVTVTSDYTETAPTNWQLDMPDLTSAGGYPSGAGLLAGTSTERGVEVYGGALSDYIGARPADGATVKFAGALTNASTMITSRSMTRGSRLQRVGRRTSFGAR